MRGATLVQVGLSPAYWFTPFWLATTIDAVAGSKLEIAFFTSAKGVKTS